MDVPWGVIAIYAALVVWAALLIDGWRRRAFRYFLGFGVLLLLALNVRYFIEGSSGAIPFFIGIYDLLDNLGLGESDTAAAMAACPDNSCTVWGDRFTRHPAWGVAFYDRFVNGSGLRNGLLYGHIAFNSVTFVLLHWQLARPGSGDARQRNRHRLVGRVSFATLTIGTLCAVILASEHGSVDEYGGNLSMVGFWFMSACVYVCAVMGVAAARRSDAASHRVWMIRFAGSMWGSFWLFRVMLFVLDPLLRNYNAAAILICIWLSAPLGIAIAEWARHRFSPIRGAAQATGMLSAPGAAG